MTVVIHTYNRKHELEEVFRYPACDGVPSIGHEINVKSKMKVLVVRRVEWDFEGRIINISTAGPYG